MGIVFVVEGISRYSNGSTGDDKKQPQQQLLVPAKDVIKEKQAIDKARGGPSNL